MHTGGGGGARQAAIQLPQLPPPYEITAERDRFRPRPLAYFQRMWKALNAEDPDRMRLYLAMHEGEALAATTMLIVGRHVWYSYGASANHKREVRPSNAIQWRMMQDAHAMGAAVYDLRTAADMPGTTCEGDVEFFVEEALRAGGPVLELGCGTGRVSWPVAEAGLDVVGLDLSPAMLRRAEAKRAKGAAKAEAELHKIARDVLSNPTIEEFSFELQAAENSKSKAEARR